MLYLIVLLKILLLLSVSADEEESSEIKKPDEAICEVQTQAENMAPGDSYSYHSFTGPVSGETQQIIVDGPRPYIDYMTKPDYAYNYGVQDPHTGVSQTHQESRNGDAVTGEYRVLQADGLMRIVTYTAGEKGFQANVRYEKTA